MNSDIRCWKMYLYEMCISSLREHFSRLLICGHPALLEPNFWVVLCISFMFSSSTLTLCIVYGWYDECSTTKYLFIDFEAFSIAAPHSPVDNNDIDGLTILFCERVRGDSMSRAVEEISGRKFISFSHKLCLREWASALVSSYIYMQIAWIFILYSAIHFNHYFILKLNKLLSNHLF